MAEKDWQERENGGGERFYGGSDVGIGFYELPEGCIATVISFTTPRDACRLAAVSKMFRSAADSDAVWDRFLPSDYADIVARSDGGAELLNSLSKKELFLRLAFRPLLIDGGTKSFSLEKSTGKKCYSVAARDLHITWGDTPRYWAWHSTPDSRFPEVAELVTVCWLEIKGKIKTSILSPDTNYVAYLIFKMAEAAYGFCSPAEVVVKTAGGKTETQKAYLDPGEGHSRSYQIIQRRVRLLSRNRASMTVTRPAMNRGRDGKLPNPRGDGWMEVEIGEFFTRRDEEGEVEMSVLEVNAGNWKGGLVVEGIEIRPKVVMQ